MTDITSTEEENKRVSMQVMNLSTQLMDSVQNQSNLEQKVGHLERENTLLKAQLKEKDNIEKRSKMLMVENKELTTRVNGLGERLETEVKAKLEAKTNVSNLEKEVEELTATLFEEANVMVSDARKETEAIKERNASLVKQLKDKDEFVSDLENQLKILKDVLHERDRDLDDANSKRDSMIITPSNPTDAPQLHKQILYSPTTDAFRYDLKLFAEFKKFIKTVKDYDTIRDTETKFIKKLLAEDVEPSLRLDTASGISYFNRRNTLTALIDGRVSIEPVSGINETYRLNFQNNKVQDSDIKSNLYTYPPHSPPVAMEQACALCGENRDDILEHSRLYIMKVYSKQDSSSNVAAGVGSPVVAHQYPLCSYCLFRLRSVCELFAFLRSLKTNVWKLNNEVMVKKAWIELSRLRSKLFWAKIGIWDIDSNIITTKITASADDAIYRAIETTADPSRHSVYSSQESLSESKAQDSSNVYRSSPLINQVHQSPQPANQQSPRTPGSISQQQDDSSSIPSEVSTEQSKEEIEETEEGDDVDDIIGDYSHNESEEDENDTTNATLQLKTSGLQIHDDDDDESRPQDSLLDSEQSTPIVNRHTTSQVNTPIADTGFDFEKTVTPTKAAPTEDEKELEVEESVPTLDPKKSKDSLNTTDDEADFVDA